MYFLSELFIFLAAALLIVPLMNRLGLSSVIGYLTAGVIIGPGGFALIDDAENILHFSEIGVVLLLFVIGLELQPRRLWIMRRSVFGLGSAQVVATTLVLALPLLLLGLEPAAALVLGFSLALSSTAFVLQLLGEKKQLNHTHGRSAFGVLLLQDLAVIPVITWLSIQGSSSDAFNPWALVAVIACLIAARYAIRPILRIIAATGIHELFIAASLALVTGAALGLYEAGLSMGLGAFVAGMMVADSEYRHQLETDVMPFKGLLLGLFFIAVGMSADLRLLWDSPAIVIGLTAGLVFLKIIAMLPVAWLFNLRRGDLLKTAVLLSQGGEFAFVLLAAGVSATLVSADDMKLAVLIVTLSMATTPFLMMLLEKLLANDDSPPFDEIHTAHHPVILAGFGRVGQIIARVLATRGIPFTAIEANPGQVDFVRSFGNDVYYGDATRLDVLQNAGVRDAKAIVITLDNIEASVKLTEMLRETCPDLAIYVRARHRQHEIKLRDLGVNGVIRDTLLSSLRLAEYVLEGLGIGQEDARHTIATFEEHDTQTLQKQAAVIHDPAAYRQTTRDAAEELAQLFRADQQG